MYWCQKYFLKNKKYYFNIFRNKKYFKKQSLSETNLKNKIETSTQENTSANEKENKQGEKGKVSGLPKRSIKTQPKLKKLDQMTMLLFSIRFTIWPYKCWLLLIPCPFTGKILHQMTRHKAMFCILQGSMSKLQSTTLCCQHLYRSV
jgi:hypothetical protein